MNSENINPIKNRFKKAAKNIINVKKVKTTNSLGNNSYNNTNILDISDNIILFILYFFLLLFVGVSLDKISKNNTGVSNKTFTFAFIGIFTCISILIIVFGTKRLGNINVELSLIIKVGYLLFAIFIFIGVVYYFDINSYLFIGISILIAIVGLSIIFNIFFNILEKSLRDTQLKFIIELIFFLPCLFNDILKWGLDQINMTSYFTYVLLLIEVILILAYFYLPTILNKIILENEGKVLQKAPFYINKGNREVIATSVDFLKKRPKQNEKNLLKQSSESNIYNEQKDVYNTDYALSMWINMNPHPIETNKEIDILSYFYYDKNKQTDYYKPKIVYTSSSNSPESKTKDVYKIYLTGTKNDTSNIVEINIPNQRWNYFVFNYVDGKLVELWVNGIMERVMKFSEDVPVPQYDTTDQIVIGSLKANGTNGAICNVIYFDKSISSRQIVNTYNYSKLTLQNIHNYPQ